MSESQPAPLSTASGNSPWSSFGWLLGGAAVLNFVAMPMVRMAEDGAGSDLNVVVVVAGLLGFWAAQLGLLSLWLVWGQGSYLRRLLIHWVAGAVLFLAWALGFAAAMASEMPGEILLNVARATACGLPAVCLAAQLPLWPLRIYFGWRVEQPGDAAAEDSQPLSIRNMLAGTLVTSVSLAALRFMPPDFVIDADFWIGWAITVAVVAGLSLVSLLPALAILLRMSQTASAATAWFGYAGLMLVATLAILSSFFGAGPPDAVFVGVAVTFFSFAGAVSLPLLIARARGLRLTFARDRQAGCQPLPAAPPSAEGPPSG